MRSVLALFFCLSSFAVIAVADAPKLLEMAPIRFEPNAFDSKPGLHPDSLKWIAHGQGYSFGFSNDETFLRVADRTVKLTFLGANHKAQFQGESQQRAATNYFVEQKRLS